MARLRWRRDRQRIDGAPVLAPLLFLLRVGFLRRLGLRQLVERLPGFSEIGVVDFRRARLARSRGVGIVAVLAEGDALFFLAVIELDAVRIDLAIALVSSTYALAAAALIASKAEISALPAGFSSIQPRV